MMERRRSARLLIGAMSLAAILAGCAPASRQMDSMDNKNAVETLAVGMSRDELVALMGKPAKRENYGSMHFYIYETSYLAFREKDRYTPVAVVNGKVAGWGRDYHDAVVKAQSGWHSELRN